MGKPKLYTLQKQGQKNDCQSCQRRKEKITKKMQIIIAADFYVNKG
jgi:hypothetical protein